MATSTIQVVIFSSIRKTMNEHFLFCLSRRVFFKGDSDEVYGLHDTIYRPKLGETLATIAETGPSAFYQGELSAGICEEIQANGGIITENDLMTYQARIKPAISVKLENNYTAYGVPPPASSAITLLILKVMDGE